MTETYHHLDLALRKLIQKEKESLEEVLTNSAQDLLYPAAKQNIDRELQGFDQLTAQHYQRGLHFLDWILHQQPSWQPRVEQLSYLRGLLQSLEKYDGGKKILKAADLSQQELYGSWPKRTVQEEEKVQEGVRAALRDGSLDGQCNFCNRKVDPEACFIRLWDPVDNSRYSVYCNNECFTMYTED